MCVESVGRERARVRERFHCGPRCGLGANRDSRRIKSTSGLPAVEEASTLWEAEHPEQYCALPWYEARGGIQGEGGC
jgi:hypothetical protein